MNLVTRGCYANLAAPSVAERDMTHNGGLAYVQGRAGWLVDECAVEGLV
jgi:hypothetical protein